MKTQIIQLESHDDLITARDKMAWSKAPRILLVWPRKGRILDRELDLVTLQRCAHSLGAQLGVVCTNVDIRAKAREVGLPVFSSLSQAQRGAWRRSKGRRRLESWLLDHPRPAVMGLRDRRKNLVGRETKRINPWLRGGVFSLGVLAVLALVLFFLPSARLELHPLRQEQSLVLDLRASPSISSADVSGSLPAYIILVTVEGSEQTPSSGRASIPDHFAEGEAEFSNLTTHSLSIPAGTILATLDNPPRRYETLFPCSLAAGVDEKARVRIRGLLPGSAANIRAGTLRAIEGDFGLMAVVTNPGDLSGGSDRTSPAPDQKNYDDLRKKLVVSLEKTATDDLTGKLEAGKVLLQGTTKVGQIISETVDPPVGTPGDFAHLTLQVEYRAWYILDSDLQSVAGSALEANRPAGFSPQVGSLKVVFVSDPVFQDDQAVHWRTGASRWLAADWNDQTAARSVVGMQPDQAVHFLQKGLALSDPPVIALSPSWWFRMPFLPFRITVVRQ